MCFCPTEPSPATLCWEFMSIPDFGIDSNLKIKRESAVSPQSRFFKIINIFNSNQYVHLCICMASSCVSLILYNSVINFNKLLKIHHFNFFIKNEAEFYDINAFQASCQGKFIIFV